MRFIVAGLGLLLVLVGCTAQPPPEPGSGTESPGSVATATSLATPAVSAAAVQAARAHLAEVMDEWGAPGELRLASSYRDGDLDDWDTAVSYDADGDRAGPDR